MKTGLDCEADGPWRDSRVKVTAEKGMVVVGMSRSRSVDICLSWPFDSEDEDDDEDLDV